MSSRSCRSEQDRAEKPAHEVLLDAAGVIMERGHCKWVLEDGPGGPVCLSGAVRVAVKGEPWEWDESIPALIDRVAHVARLRRDDNDVHVGNNSAVDWNNERASKRKVIAALDAAAVVAMQEAGLEPEDVLCP